ncbi:nucleotide pyrophosphohydrolase [Craterilacuibacter sp.]|uniref:nucleotide pyrophosphohydrolase n=1 Tax=Craterilacuibacter sp. TaxID=2870909 RepID=UPI003F32EEE7
MASEKLLDVDPLLERLQQFADARDWQRFHTPKNLVLALTGEVGELAEIFQWKTDAEAVALHQNPAEFEHLGEEIADVLLYLVRLAQVSGIDLEHAVADKLLKNAKKYPAA